MKIGKREIDLSFISAERVIKSADMYNKAIKDRLEKKETDYFFTKKLVKVAVYVIHAPVINISDIGFKLWVRRNLVSAYILMKTIKYADLDDFLNEALEPILGSKKKEIDRQRSLEDAGQKIIEEMGAEKLSELLASFAPSTGGKKTTVTGV